MTVRDLLQLLRENDWTVAVHNDYKLNGASMTFWLFTKTEEVACRYADGLYVKGEGLTDLEALREIARKLRLL